MTQFRKQLSAGKEQLLQSARLNIVARVAPGRVLHRTAHLSPDTYDRLGVSAARTLLAPERIDLPGEELRRFLARQVAVPHTDGSFMTEDVKVWALDDARLDPATGAVVSADNTLLIDSIKNDGRLRRVAAYGRATPPSRPVPGPISTIMCTHTSNHFHWLLEALPRLHSLALVGQPVTLVMPDTLSPMQRETLAACLPGNVDLAIGAATEWVRADQLVLPSFLTRQWDFAYLPSGHLQATRAAILAAHSLPNRHEGTQRIYISRARAGVRHVINEAAVVELLSEFGFRMVYLEALSFAEQVRTLHDASVVVAPHGAGLANLLFAGRIPVVELTTPVTTPVYFFLALALGQDYRYVLPAETPPEPVIRSLADARRYSAARDQDITVPLEELRTVLRQIL